MDEHLHLPDTNQLSILSATIMLAYALTPFVRLPETNLVLRLPFAVFEFTLSFNTIVSVLTALLAAVGTDWLLRSHPHREGASLWQHVLLPALTAWTIGVPLSTLTIGPQWWAVFAMGGVLLVLVFIAEYIVVDFQDSAARSGDDWPDGAFLCPVFDPGDCCSRRELAPVSAPPAPGWSSGAGLFTYVVPARRQRLVSDLDLRDRYSNR